MKSSNNTYGEQWHECDRCGFSFPMSRLVRQDGLLVCRENCVFEKGRDYYLKHSPVPTEGGSTEPQGDEVSS